MLLRFVLRCSCLFAKQKLFIDYVIDVIRLYGECTSICDSVTDKNQASGSAWQREIY